MDNRNVSFIAENYSFYQLLFGSFDRKLFRVLFLGLVCSTDINIDLITKSRINPVILIFFNRFCLYLISNIRILLQSQCIEKLSAQYNRFIRSNNVIFHRCHYNWTLIHSKVNIMKIQCNHFRVQSALHIVNYDVQLKIHIHQCKFIHLLHNILNTLMLIFINQIIPMHLISHQTYDQFIGE